MYTAEPWLFPWEDYYVDSEEEDYQDSEDEDYVDSEDENYYEDVEEKKQTSENFGGRASGMWECPLQISRES